VKELLDCPICTQPSAFEQRSEDADLYRCPHCDHCFSNPLSVQAPENYGPDYFQKNWFRHENTKLFKKLGKVFVDHKPNAAVLDVGCGDGALLRFLRRSYQGLSLTGLDLRENEPEDGVQFYQGDFLSVDLQQQFDIVVSLAVIEHLFDVNTFVKRLVSLCIPGGLVAVMTINDRSVLYETARVLRRVGFPQPYDQLYSRHHLNHFNSRSFATLMRNNGLTVDLTLRHNIPMASIDIDFSSVSPRISWIHRAGVLGTFIIGRLIGRTYKQTVICRNRSRDEASCGAGRPPSRSGPHRPRTASVP
jgi:trans-aconitate methyltransferase